MKRFVIAAMMLALMGGLLLLPAQDWKNPQLEQHPDFPTPSGGSGPGPDCPNRVYICNQFCSSLFGYEFCVPIYCYWECR